MDATATEPRPWKVAHNQRIDGRGISLLENALLTENILPLVPRIAMCYDMVTDFNVRFYRFQVRSTGFSHKKPDTGVPPKSITFSILRKKTKKPADGRLIPDRNFNEKEIDGFAFIHVEYGLFFIVPVEAMDLNRTKFTVHVGDQWQNAWGILK